MSEFFKIVFEAWGFFSTAQGLGDYLDGVSTDCQFNGASIYNTIGFISIGLTFFQVINYYYGIFNKVRFSHRLAWFLNMLLAAGITGGIAYGYAIPTLPDGEHCKALYITQGDCFGFGFAAFLNSIISFAALSVIIKWGSKNNSKVPF